MLIAHSSYGRDRDFPEWCKGGLHKYLIERAELARIGEICALDDESGFEGKATLIRVSWHRATSPLLWKMRVAITLK
jgi:hypothetical protein